MAREISRNDEPPEFYETHEEEALRIKVDEWFDACPIPLTTYRRFKVERVLEDARGFDNV